MIRPLIRGRKAEAGGSFKGVDVALNVYPFSPNPKRNGLPAFLENWADFPDGRKLSQSACPDDPVLQPTIGPLDLVFGLTKLPGILRIEIKKSEEAGLPDTSHFLSIRMIKNTSE